MTDEAEVPQHVAIIMDGNGRWAEEKRHPRNTGHEAGVEAGESVFPCFFQRGVKVVTVYAFSTENWKRNKEEVEGLFALFQKAIVEAGPKFLKQNIRIAFIGDRSALDPGLQRGMAEIERESAGNTGGILLVAINYGGWDEMERAIKRIIKDGVPSEEVNEELIGQYLDTGILPADLRNVDLLIRTAGEERSSGFLPLQIAYAEYWSTETLWPDFTEKTVEEAFEVFASRTRKFGAVPTGANS